MRVYRAKDYKDMSRKAANIISAQIHFETKQCYLDWQLALRQ